MTALDRLRELEPKATPGPWGLSRDTGPRRRVFHYDDHGAAFTIADVVTWEGPDVDAALIAESRDVLRDLLTLEALARDEHDKRCTCTGEACKLGEVLRVLDGEAL